MIFATAFTSTKQERRALRPAVFLPVPQVTDES